jgi:hypothetical protein
MASLTINSPNCPLQVVVCSNVSHAVSEWPLFKTIHVCEVVSYVAILVPRVVPVSFSSTGGTSLGRKGTREGLRRYSLYMGWKWIEKYFVKWRRRMVSHLLFSTHIQKLNHCREWDVCKKLPTTPTNLNIIPV